MWRSVFALLGLIFLLETSGHTQMVNVTVETERAQYLLFEPVMLRITLRNNSGQDLVFDKPEGSDQSWINFLITRSDASIVKPEQSTQFERLLLPAGESKSIVVNITPLYSFRETGPYKVRTAVEIAGRQFLSGYHEFTIISGHKIWEEKKSVDGSLRTYSLLRFTPDTQSTYLYLRVEDESQNLVYTTQRLGEIVAFTDPQTAFDSDGFLHIIHVSGLGIYRYTRVDSSGIIAKALTYASINDNRPQLISSKENGILVVGGRLEDQSTRRERLSEGQVPLKKAAPSIPESKSSSPSAAPLTRP